MFKLSAKPIIPVSPEIVHPHAGGVVFFEGRVRALNEGKLVTRLDYEAYPELCAREGAIILQEAKAQFPLYEVYAIHRSGRLVIGDIAIWVYASAMHRREAFLATEYIVHEIKHRLPIWKKEWYQNGASDWVRCAHHEQEVHYVHV